MRTRVWRIQKIDFPNYYRRVIRHCKTCQYKCDKKEPIVGCESIMAPGYLEVFGEEYTWFYVQRTWFDKDYNSVEKWPTHEEILRMKKEFEKQSGKNMG